MNVHSRPVQSQFVPTYAPPNLQAIAAGGQQLEQKQQQGLEMYDQVENTFNEYSSKFLSEDKHIIDRYRESFNEATEPLMETGDFIDAAPMLRRQARNLQRELTQGEGALAMKNFETMTDNIERLRDSDLPTNIIAGMENRMLSSYKGVENGDAVQRINIPEYVDIDSLARELAKEIKPDILESIGWIQNSDGTYSNEAYQGKVRRETLPREEIYRIVRPQLMNDPRVVDYLRFEAQATGAEDATDYAESRILSAIYHAGETYNRDNRTISNVRWESPTSAGTSGVFTSTGSLVADDINRDLRTTLRDVSSAVLTGDNATAVTKSSNLKITLSDAVKEGVITTDEFNEFFEILDKHNYSLLGAPGTQFGGMGAGSGQYTAYMLDAGLIDVDSMSEGAFSEDNFEELFNKVDNYLNTRGDYSSTSLILSNERDQNRVRAAFSQIPASSLSIVNESFTPDEEVQIIREIQRAGDSPNITYTDNKVLFEIPYEDEDGDIRSYILEEKLQPNQEGFESNLTTTVADIIGGDEGQRLKDRHVLRSVPAMSGNNLLEYGLPPRFMQQGQSHISLQADPRGKVNLVLAEGDEEPSPFTYKDMLISLDPDDQNNTFSHFMAEIATINREFNIFDERDIREMEQVGGLSTRLLDYINSLPQLDEAYAFEDHIHALKFNSGINE